MRRSVKKAGCVLLVKLHQFQSGDDKHVVIDTQATPWLPGHGGLGSHAPV